ncbi:MAG TPA: serine hydrolase domain-containing protein [Gemmatimonadaceae bacterium]|nr:serine hydrolase domain-containing protein [Gemmatimonadaceae bacterium]
MRSLDARPLLLLALAACSSPATKASAPPNADSAIARVTMGLRTGIAIKGDPVATFSLAERMAHYKVPGVSIAVVDSGRIVWARGYGLKESGTTDSVTATTIFQAASISKPVAATGMLRLVEEGRLALDTPVNAYLKSWTLPDNAFTAKEKVTLRRIVSHSAGLTVHGFPGYAATDPVPTVPQVLDGARPANTAPVRVDTFPGAISRYSGGGITIEQLAMTDVTGEAFPALLKRLVLDPIGMTNSGYDQPLAGPRIAQAAAGYRPDGTIIQGRWHTYPELAAAGLWTTPTDLLKWAMEIAAARDGQSTKVLSRKMATEMLTSQKEAFGLGPALGGKGKGFNFGHGGANEGYRAQVTYFPELGRGAAVMTNSDNGSALAQEILFAIAKEYQWVDYGPREIAPIALDAAALDALTGTYATDTPEKIRLSLTREGTTLYVDEPKYVPRTEVRLLGATKAIALETGMEFTFLTDAKGTVTGIDLPPMKLTRAKK